MSSWKNAGGDDDDDDRNASGKTTILLQLFPVNEEDPINKNAGDDDDDDDDDDGNNASGKKTTLLQLFPINEEPINKNAGKEAIGNDQQEDNNNKKREDKDDVDSTNSSARKKKKRSSADAEISSSDIKNPRKCELCGQVMNTPHGLTIHLGVMHPEWEKEDIIDAESSEDKLHDTSSATARNKKRSAAHADAEISSEDIKINPLTKNRKTGRDHAVLRKCDICGWEMNTTPRGLISHKGEMHPGWDKN